MDYLIDTNLLVRAVDRTDPLCRTSRVVLSKLTEGHHHLYLLPQITAEFWVVCTRPKEKNGLGYAPARVQRYITRFESVFLTLLETERVYQEWKRLISVHAVIGMEAHDARIVAAMVVHGVQKIITFNVDDFKAYENIHVIHPEEL